VKLFWRKFTNVTGKFFYTRNTLVFLNGFLIASLFYFYIEDNYEKKVFETLALFVNSKTPVTANREEALLLNSLHITHYLGTSRSNIFSIKEVQSFKSSVIHPVTYDLMTTNGACGSYSYILSRLLNELNITNRIAQMKVNGKYGGHILVEAKTSKGWVVLDGSYNLYFKKENGQLASFNDVQNNWDYYRTQVPANYDLRYKFDGVRYTNWNKIPIIMPLIKGILRLVVGKEAADHFSFRTFFLRKFHLLFEVTLFICLVCLGVAIRNFLRRHPRFLKKYFPFIHLKNKPLLVMGTGTEVRRA
jgi:hypothetical protein